MALGVSCGSCSLSSKSGNLVRRARQVAGTGGVNTEAAGRQILRAPAEGLGTAGALASRRARRQMKIFTC